MHAGPGGPERGIRRFVRSAGIRRRAAKAVPYDCRRPPGPSFGAAVLGHMPEYAGRKNTGADTAYCLEDLNGRKCSPYSVWNARRAPAAVLAPAVRQMMEDLKKAPYLIMYETPYPCRLLQCPA